MKKYLLLVLLLLLPFGVYAEECDSTKVKIKSINLDSKSESTEILEEAQFVDGSFKEEKVLSISLANEEKNTTINPTTLKNIYILIFVLLLVTLLLFTAIHNQKIKNKTMILILGCSLIIPFGVKALCTYDIQVNSHIEVEQPKVCVISGSPGCDSVFTTNSIISYLTFEEAREMLYYIVPPFYFINRDDFACYEDAYNQYHETHDWEQYDQHVLSCPVSFEDSLHELPEEFYQELLTSDKGSYNTIPTDFLC